MVKIAPKMYVREVSAEDADRLLASGSWCIVQSSERDPRGTQRAKRWRKFSRKRKANGYRAYHAYLSPEDADAFEAAKLPGETKAAAIARLARAALASRAEPRADRQSALDNDAENDPEIEQP